MRRYQAQEQTNSDSSERQYMAKVGESFYFTLHVFAGESFHFNMVIFYF